MRPEILQRDSVRWQKRGPYWKKTAEEKAKLSPTEIETLCRRGGRPPFVMDVISMEATKAGQRKLEEIEKLFSLAGKGVSDVHLMQPWFKALDVADRYRKHEQCDRRHRDLKKISEHVECMYFQRHRSMSEAHANDAATDQPPMRPKAIRTLSRQFASTPRAQDLLMDVRDISRLRASYAYYYDSVQATKTGWSQFPWDMAVRDLCAIKGMFPSHEGWQH